MAHLVKDILDRAAFNRLAGIHHADPVAGLEDEPKVVADEQHRGAVFLAQVLDQFDNCGLHRHVKGGGGLVEDEKRGFRHQRHGDDDPLLLAARQLVRIAVQDPLGVRQLDVRHHLECALVGGLFVDPFVDHRHFHQLLADLHCRVQRGHRLLVDHRDLAAANVAQLFWAHGVEVASLELDRAADDPAVDAKVLHDPQRHGGFATTGFAHKAQCLARHDLGRKVHHSRDFAQSGKEADRQFVNLKDRAVVNFTVQVEVTGALISQALVGHGRVSVS